MTAEQAFEMVGDEKLFPNHTDKDIWVSSWECACDQISENVPALMALVQAKIIGLYRSKAGKVEPIFNSEPMHGGYFIKTIFVSNLFGSMESNYLAQSRDILFFEEGKSLKDELSDPIAWYKKFNEFASR